MNPNSLYKDALKLRPADRLKLIEMLTESLNRQDEKIEQIWAEEVEKRYSALKAGKVRTINLSEIIERYK